MNTKCDKCGQGIEMQSTSCVHCGHDRTAELKIANATGAAIISTQLVSMAIGWIVAGEEGVLCGAGFGLFMGFVTLVFYNRALAVE